MYATVIGLVHNSALLLALCLLYDILAGSLDMRGRPLRRLAAGLMVGSVGIMVMLTPWVMADGLIFDTRTVLLSVSGLFFGSLPTLVAMAMCGALRLFQGGQGAMVGVLTVLVSGGIGLICRQLWKRRLEQACFGQLFLFGLVVHLAILASFGLLLPSAVAPAVLRAMWMPMLLLYPAVTAAVGVLLGRRERRAGMARRLAESEARLRSYLDNSPDAVFVINADGRLLEANPAACELTGRMRDELLGGALAELVVPEDRERFVAMLGRVGGTGRQSDELHILRGDGAVREWNMNTVTLPGGDMLVHAADVTLRNRAVGALAASESRLRAIFENVDQVAVQGYDEQRRVIFWNGASEQLYGYPAEEAMGRRLEELIIPESRRDEAVRAVADWMERGVPTPSGEEDLVDRNGRIVPVYSAHVMREGPSGAMEMFRVDVGLEHTRRMEAELRAARDAAEAASAVKSNFLANMSHELRTPLNGIMGMLQLLIEDESDEDRRESLDLALSAGRNLTRLLNDILDISRIEADRMRLESMPFSPVALLEDIARSFSPRAAAKGVELRVSAGPGLPALLQGDPGRVRQVLSNLAGNAVKFTECGTVEVDLSPLPGVHPGECRILLTVSDTGIGVAEHDLDRIFEPFTQVDSSYTRRFEGAGLGLQIVRRLVLLMGGSMAVESEPGAGTTFYCSIPFQTVLDARPEVRDAAAKGIVPAVAPEREPGETYSDAASAPDRGCDDSVASSLPPSLPAKSGRPLARILVAEDDRINAVAVTRMLQGLEYETAHVRDGAQAVAAVRDGEFDLVMMDVQMPGMDGVEATAHIRALDGRKSRIPIIALTAYAMDGDRERFLAAGMDDYVSKPVDLPELIAAVRRLLDD